jgi:hypothetical protein
MKITNKLAAHVVNTVNIVAYETLSGRYTSLEPFLKQFDMLALKNISIWQYDSLCPSQYSQIL